MCAKLASRLKFVIEEKTRICINSPTIFLLPISGLKKQALVKNTKLEHMMKETRDWEESGPLGAKHLCMNVNSDLSLPVKRKDLINRT